MCGRPNVSSGPPSQAEELRDGDLVLRAPRCGDVTARIELGRSAAIVRLFGGSRSDFDEVTEAEAERWVARLSEPPTVGWIVEHDGRVVGSARLDDIDRRDLRATYAIGLLDEEVLGRGLGTRATMLVLRHAFGQMGLHRVGLRVIEYNRRAIACYANCGFVQEGREREAALVDGERHDDVLMGVLAHEFAELSRNGDEASHRQR